MQQATLTITDGLNEALILIDEATLRAMALVLRSTEHPIRMVRTDATNERNLPYQNLNMIGDTISYEMGFGDDETDDHRT
jgi:hypothetical protein